MPGPVVQTPIGQLLTAIEKGASQAKNEAEFRQDFEFYLRKFSLDTNWPVEFKTQKEVSILVGETRGRIDSLFGQIVIEYKAPGRLSKTNKTKLNADALQKMRDQYLPAAATSSGLPKSRLLGVVFDGKRICYTRYDEQSAQWIVPDEAKAFDLPALSEFILYLRSLHRRQLTPEAVGSALGIGSEVGTKVVVALYEALHHPTPRTQLLYKEWYRIFSIIYGTALAEPPEDVRRLAVSYGLSESETEFSQLLFAVQTYYSLVVKVIGAELLMELQRFGSFLTDVQASGDIRTHLQRLESGSVFRDFGIENFLEGTYFSWYLEEWKPPVAEAVAELLATLQTFEPQTAIVLPESTRDLMKRLYQFLVPKRVRHKLGEYYTPDWLSEFTLTQAGYDGNPNSRVLDPTCGSGTFLVSAIRKVREYARAKKLSEEFVLAQVLKNIVGYDINPIAVISARMNYIMALGELLKYSAFEERIIPVFSCDSVLVAGKRVDYAGVDLFSVPTTVREFLLPTKTVRKIGLEALTQLMEESLRAELEIGGFETDLRAMLPEEYHNEMSYVVDVYRVLLDLHKRGLNEFWPRMIQNAFAPRQRPKFDFVVGNPPWISWEHIAPPYRDATKGLWDHYRLVSDAKHLRRLGKGKRDLSMLVTYVAVDQYLKDKCRIAFVITESVFKSTAGYEFRRFGTEASLFAVEKYFDLVEIDPFDEPANRTAVFVAKKGAKTSYPVEAEIWARAGKLSEEMSLDQVLARVSRTNARASPAGRDSQEVWSVVAPGAETGPTGQSPYFDSAIQGMNPRGAAGAIFLEAGEARGKLRAVANRPERGRETDLARISGFVEAEFLYPVVHGKDVREFFIAVQDHAIVCYESGWQPIPEAELGKRAPATLSYLNNFRESLKARGKFRNFDPSENAFYELYGVGPPIFSSYKVVWREQLEPLTAAVVGPIDARPVLPDHKLYFVPVAGEAEAYYLAGVLNSDHVRRRVSSFMIGTQMGKAILRHIPIPKFDSSNVLHVDIAAAARALATSGDGRGALDARVTSLLAGAE